VVILLVLLVFLCAVCACDEKTVHFTIIVSHNVGELVLPPLADQGRRLSVYEALPFTVVIIKRWKDERHIV
jgi:hypothetical protein